MKLRKINSKGFSHVEMVIVVLVVAVLGLVGWRVLKNTSHAGSNCTGQTLNASANGQYVGSTGQCVTYLQIISIGFTGIQMPVDGLFGPLTRLNILTFQRTAFPTDRNQWDGIVGPKTWAKLCSLVPANRTVEVYNAQKAACGKATFNLPGDKGPTSTPTDYGFGWLNGITSDSLGHIWVPNMRYNSLTEINAKDGSLVKVYSDPSYGFKSPIQVTTDKLGHIWVANYNSLTEINAKDGSLVKVYSDPSYELNGPYAMTADDQGHLWVTNSNAFTLTEINAKDGSLVKVYSNYNLYGFSWNLASTTDNLGHLWVSNGNISGSLTEINTNDGSVVTVYGNVREYSFEKNTFNKNYGFNVPYGITSDNLGHIWVVNLEKDTITELNAKDGSLVKVYSDPSLGLKEPITIMADNSGHVWVVNILGNSLTELNAKDGSLVKVYSNPSLGLKSPSGITSDNLGHLWIVNSIGNTVTELNAKDGSLVKIYK